MRHPLRSVFAILAIMAAGGCACGGTTKTVSLTDQNRAYVALADAAVAEKLRAVNEHLSKRSSRSSGENEFTLGDFRRKLEIGCERDFGWRGAVRPVLTARYTSTCRIAGLGQVASHVTVYMDDNELVCNASATEVLD